jgi:hypothetical protein
MPPGRIRSSLRCGRREPRCWPQPTTIWRNSSSDFGRSRRGRGVQSSAFPRALRSRRARQRRRVMPATFAVEQTAHPTNPLTGTKRFATGSTPSNKLSRATAPRSAGLLSAIRHCVVTSGPSSARRTSASGHDSSRPPAVWIGHILSVRKSSRSASERGTTRKVAPVSTRRSTVSLRPVGPVRRPET